MNKVLSAGLVVIVVLSGYFFWFKPRSDYARLVQEVRAGMNVAQVEMNQVVTGYQSRLDLILDMVKQKAFVPKTAEDVERKVQFLRNLKVEGQIELDQFDQVQNDLSNKAAEYFVSVQQNPSLRSSAAFRNFLKKFEELERSIEKSRNSYSDAALKTNQLIKSNSRLRKEFRELPVFKAAEAGR
jgi:hypothetical protein